jgi:hypothetical protein
MTRKKYLDDQGYYRYSDSNRKVSRETAYNQIYKKGKYSHPFGYYHVHHIDEEKTNDHSSNLRIMTPEQHMNHHKIKRGSNGGGIGSNRPNKTNEDPDMEAYWALLFLPLFIGSIVGINFLINYMTSVHNIMIVAITAGLMCLFIAWVIKCHNEEKKLFGIKITYLMIIVFILFIMTILGKFDNIVEFQAAINLFVIATKIGLICLLFEWVIKCHNEEWKLFGIKITYLLIAFLIISVIANWNLFDGYLGEVQGINNTFLNFLEVGLICLLFYVVIKCHNEEKKLFGIKITYLLILLSSIFFIYSGGIFEDNLLIKNSEYDELNNHINDEEMFKWYCEMSCLDFYNGNGKGMIAQYGNSDRFTPCSCHLNNEQMTLLFSFDRSKNKVISLEEMYKHKG